MENTLLVNLNWGAQNRSDQNILISYFWPYSFCLFPIDYSPWGEQPGMVRWLGEACLAQRAKGLPKRGRPGIEPEMGYKNVLITQRSNRAIGVSKLDYYTARGPPGGQFSISEEIRLQNPLY